MHMIDSGVKMTPVIIDGRWREIDTVQDLTRAEASGGLGLPMQNDRGIMRAMRLGDSLFPTPASVGVGRRLRPGQRG